MPKGVYKKTEEHIRKIGLANSISRKGMKLSEEHKKNVKKNHAKYWLGKKRPPFSEEWKNKIRETNKKNGRKPLLGKKGKDSPAWKGGITPIGHAIRGSKEYKKWRDSIFKRDNYTCIWCGNKNGNGKTITLNVDHFPVSFSMIMHKLIIEQGIENLFEKSLNYSLFWNLDNGRTLCVSCHRTTFSSDNIIRKYKSKVEYAK